MHLHNNFLDSYIANQGHVILQLMTNLVAVCRTIFQHRACSWHYVADHRYWRLLEQYLLVLFVDQHPHHWLCVNNGCAWLSGNLNNRSQNALLPFVTIHYQKDQYLLIAVLFLHSRLRRMIRLITI